MLAAHDQWIWLIDAEGHVWRIDAIAGELEQAPRFPEDAWSERFGPAFPSVSGVKPKWLDDEPRTHPQRWTGVRRLELVDCPRCRLKITPRRGSALTTEQVFFNPELFDTYHRTTRALAGRDNIVFHEVPVLVEHATSLGGDATRQVSLVKLDGSLAWTTDQAYKKQLWLDDRILVTHELTQPNNRHKIRAIDLSTGELAWTLDYPR